MSLNINYPAILFAVLFNQVFGFLWYSKFFKKPWAKYFYGQADGCVSPPPKIVFIQSMLVFVMSSFLTAFVLNVALGFYWQYRAVLGGEATFMQSLELSFLIFIGFFLH